MHPENLKSLMGMAHWKTSAYGMVSVHLLVALFGEALVLWSWSWNCGVADVDAERIMTLLPSY
jgi:hypothetical protein